MSQILRVKTAARQLASYIALQPCISVTHYSRSVATKLWAGRSGFRIPLGARDNSLLQKSRSDIWPTKYPISRVHRYFQGLKRPECHVGQSRPCSSEVKNEWSYTSVPPVCLHDVDRDNLTFTFTFFLKPGSMIPMMTSISRTLLDFALYLTVTSRDGIFVEIRGWAWGKQYSARKQTLVRRFINLLKPNDIYICRTATLTSRRYILNIYSTNIHTEYFKRAA